MEDKVGFEDCDRTLLMLSKLLTRNSITVRREHLESALWSCNLMDEAGEFWSPRGESFDEFVNRLLLPYQGEFDKFYNLIQDGRDER